MPDQKFTNRWVANWIWAWTPFRDTERQVVALKKTADLKTVPASAPGRIFADSHYILFVNGSEVARGPGRANPHARRYDLVELAPFLKVGVNVITVLAAYNNTANRNWMPAPMMIPNLANGVVVLEADIGLAAPFKTDDTWMGTVIEGWTLSEPTGVVSRRGLELIDLRNIPVDLHSPDSDAEKWRRVNIKSGRGMGDRESDHPPSYPYGPTAPSMISSLQITEIPFEERANGEWYLPEIASGTLVFDISGDDGDEIRVDPAEIIEADGSLRPAHEPQGLEIIAATRRVKLETIDMFGVRVLKIDAPESVTVHSITMRERTYPVTGNGEFRCNDPFYEALYKAGRRTVTLCSCDAYVDNPTREGRAWTADMVVHQMVDFASNADWNLARWHPIMASKSSTAYGMIPGAVACDGEHGQFGVINDWSLHWLHAVWNIYRYVGDVDEIADLLPEVERVVRYFDQFINPASGLPTDVFGWTLVDWAWVENNGASAVLAALIGRACLDLAEMAEFVGDAGRAARARARHDKLKTAFEAFWDPDRNRYADTLILGEYGPNASVHSHAAAVMADFVPNDRKDRVIELLSNKDLHVNATLSVPEGDPGMDGAVLTPGAEMMLIELPPAWWDADQKIVHAQPFFRYVVHDALEALGRADLIYDSLADWKHLLDRCSTSFSETFWGGSIAQGWASTPTRDLITRAAGIQPGEPGFKTASINPELGPLEWLEAIAPTPFGEIKVHVTENEITLSTPVPAVVEGQKVGIGDHVLSRS